MFVARSKTSSRTWRKSHGYERRKNQQFGLTAEKAYSVVEFIIGPGDYTVPGKIG
jgi:hypothetical protein